MQRGGAHSKRGGCAEEKFTAISQRRAANAPLDAVGCIYPSQHAEPPPGEGPSRIETAVEKLVDNAFKYSVPGDRVHCDLRVETGVARLVVRNEVIGMSQDEVAGLFKRFGRMVNTQNSYIGGAGLGLYLSREIARLHGGEIEAASAVGRGSRFDLTLPLKKLPNGAGSLEESK